MSSQKNSSHILVRMSLPGSALMLGIFRVMLGGCVFYFSSSAVFDFFDHVPSATRAKSIFPKWVELKTHALAMPYLQFSTQILSVAFMLGFFTRVIAPLLFGSFIFLFLSHYLRFDAPVPWLYLWFPLLVMCFCRCSDRCSIDAWFKKSEPANRDLSLYRWPMELMVAWFAYIYVAAGVAKIIPFHKVLAWSDGGTSHHIIYHRFLDSWLFYFFDKPLFDYTGYSWLFALLSIGALLLEMAVIVVLFTNKYHLHILVCILSMHVFLAMVGVTGFFVTACVLGFCLLPQSWFKTSCRC